MGCKPLRHFLASAELGYQGGVEPRLVDVKLRVGEKAVAVEALDVVTFEGRAGSMSSAAMRRSRYWLEERTSFRVLYASRYSTASTPKVDFAVADGRPGRTSLVCGRDEGGGWRRTATICRARSAAPVHVGSVLDPYDMNDGVLVERPVDDPVGPAARRVVADQLAPERLAYTARLVVKGAAAEFPDGEGDRQGQLRRL